MNLLPVSHLLVSMMTTLIPCIVAHSDNVHYVPVYRVLRQQRCHCSSLVDTR